MAETRAAHGRNAVCVVGEDTCFGLKAADLETITARGVFLTNLTAPGRKEV